jgi:hypothetical protein
MKTFRPGLPAVFTDEDAATPAVPNRAFTPAEKAAGVDKPFPTPAEAMALAAARHAATQQSASATVHTETAPSPNPGASSAPATTQVIPPVAPQPLVDHTANTFGHIQPPPGATLQTPPATEPPAANPLMLTPEEEAELDALLAKRDHVRHP